MARLVKISPIIIQRGNNRQVCFVHYIDMKAYLHWLKLFSKKYQIGIHAWVLMTNLMHVTKYTHFPYRGQSKFKLVII
jgi:putative transposase